MFSNSSTEAVGKLALTKLSGWLSAGHLSIQHNLNLLIEDCVPLSVNEPHDHCATARSRWLVLYITRGGKISKKGQNWSMEFFKNNHLDNITILNESLD